MKKVGIFLKKFLEYVSAIYLAAIVIIIFINVVLRYGFNKGISWTEEVTVDLFIWVIFIGAILAAWDKLHIKVEVFVSKMPQKIQKFCLIFGNIIVLIGFAIMVYGAYLLTVATNESVSSTTGIPASYINVALLISLIGMGIIVLFQTYKSLRQK